MKKKEKSVEKKVVQDDRVWLVLRFGDQTKVKRRAMTFSSQLRKRDHRKGEF